MASDWIEIRGAREHNLKNVERAHPARPAGRDHRPVRLGQVVAGVRHALRRGSAALRRVALGLRAAVPRADGEARRRLHRGPLAGHLDRPEDHLAQPALDGRHRHRDLRLPAPAVRARRARRTARSAAGRSPASRPSRSSTRCWRCPRARAFTVDAPVVRGRKGEFKDVFESLRGEGFTRVRVDGETRLLEEGIELDKKFKHDIAVVVDRLVMKDDLRKRLADSVETALALADGLVEHRGRRRRDHASYSEKFACPEHGVSLPELAPRVFSFNSPHGACPRCHGLGAHARARSRHDRARRRRCRSPTARSLPWNVPARASTRAPSWRSPSTTSLARDAVGRAARRAAQAVPVRHRRRAACYVTYRTAHGPQAPVHDGLRGHHRRARPPLPRDRVVAAARADRAVHDARPCPACNGARLKPESLAVTVGEPQHPRGRPACRWRAARTWVDGLELTETEQLIAERIAARDSRAARRSWSTSALDYLTLDRAAGDAVRRRGAAHPARDADRLAAWSACCTSSTSRRSACTSATTSACIDTLERLRDLGNTVIVVEHDEDTMRAADWVDRHRARRRRARRRGRRRGHARQGRRATAASLTGAYLSGRRRIADARASAAASDERAARSAARAQHNLQEHRRRDPARARSSCVTGVSRLGQVDARQRRHPARRSQQPAPQRAPMQAGRARPRSRASSTLDKVIDIDQSPIGRTPRSNPATYIGLFDHIRELFAADARRQGARLQAGPLLLQRQGRPLRGLRGRRHHQDRDALPARRLRRRARSARASATTARRSRCASRARPSPTCSR